MRWASIAAVVGVVMGVLSLALGIFSPPLFVAAQSGSSCGVPCFVDASLAGFPGVKAWIIAENMFYFAALILFVVFFTGLQRAFRSGKGLAPSTFGKNLALMGLAMEFVGALPAVAFAHLSEVYQVSSPSDQAILVLASHAVQSIFNATDTVGGFLLSIGFLLFGVAVLQTSAVFGRKFGITTIVLSLVAIAGISLVSIVMDNPNDFFFIILILILPLILGLNLYRLSKRG